MTAYSSLPELWSQKLQQRALSGQQRFLKTPLPIDFCSNDYLGFARMPAPAAALSHGATGSRLLSGQNASISALEQRIASFHNGAAALIFNSGFDANIGTLAAISDRHTVFLYDELCHASLIDGMRLSLAKHVYKFRHNDMTHLAELLQAHAHQAIAVVVESIYSMDGDIAPLQKIVDLCTPYHACLVVDEAHSTGVWGQNGVGLVQDLGLENAVGVRIHTYGKAMGCHGAAVVGSQTLIDCLINFARPFIYSTALPPASYAAIERAYDDLHTKHHHAQKQLFAVINDFHTLMRQYDWSSVNVRWLDSPTPIQGLLIGDVTRTRAIAQQLQAHQLDVRPIFSPTVAAGTERLRICLHAFNTLDELNLLFKTLWQGFNP